MGLVYKKFDEWCVRFIWRYVAIFHAIFVNGHVTGNEKYTSACCWNESEKRMQITVLELDLKELLKKKEEEEEEHPPPLKIW